MISSGTAQALKFVCLLCGVMIWPRRNSAPKNDTADDGSTNDGGGVFGLKIIADDPAKQTASPPAMTGKIGNIPDSDTAAMLAAGWVPTDDPAATQPVNCEADPATATIAVLAQSGGCMSVGSIPPRPTRANGLRLSEERARALTLPLSLRLCRSE